MLSQTTLISILFIGVVAAILFVYIQQKTSRIEKNIKNVISFIKDIEKRIEENKQDVGDVGDVGDVHDAQGISNEFFNIEQNEVVEQESESESESDQEEEEEKQQDNQEEQVEATLDDEIININFKINNEEKDYKKLPVAQLRELALSLHLDIKGVQKLKKKDIIKLLDDHFTNKSEDNNINI
jgi:signal recognition particle receptor subunit beta